MDAKDLAALWTAPDNSRLTARQSSFRLPVHVAAKIAALCDLYPSKTKTQIVGDLLATALKGFEDGLPQVKGRRLGALDDGTDIYLDVGPFARYAELANKYNAELEQELGNDTPNPIVGERHIEEPQR